MKVRTDSETGWGGRVVPTGALADPCGGSGGRGGHAAGGPRDTDT